MRVLIFLALMIMPTLLDAHGRPLPSARPAELARAAFGQRLRARYDVAQTSDENERHWANADFLSVNAAHRPEIRRRIRARARYEAQENNSYAKGMVLTLANDVVGTGPRLQLLTPDKAANARVQLSFDNWARQTRLAETLRTLQLAYVVDGEGFLLLGNNAALDHDVQLQLTPVEADQFDLPFFATFQREEEEVDGIRFDRWGNPNQYFLLDDHPGAMWQWMAGEGRWISARDVLHLFRSDRPGQRRGVSHLAPALPLFAMLRRFTLATLAAAEVAADYAGILHTQASANCEPVELPESQWFDAIPIEYRAMLTLPNGWDMKQLRAEHPSTTYAMFKREVINEIARCLNMPYNVAAANSAEYNYASGRMDHQVYFRAVAIEQHRLECVILDRVLTAWLDEAVLVPGLLPEVPGRIADWDWQWFWDSPGHVDPQKEANAQGTRIASGTSHRGREYSRAGLDIDSEDAAAADSYGVSVEEYRRALFAKHMSAPAGSAAPLPEEDEDDAPVSRRA